MKTYCSPTSQVKLKPRASVTSQAFLKSINRLASRDSFSPCSPKNSSGITFGLHAAEPLARGVQKNFGHLPQKVCTRCDTPLVINSNITEYRFKHSYFMCTHCFCLAHKGYNEKRATTKKPTYSIEKRRAELQEQIRYLMDELNYLNEASRYP